MLETSENKHGAAKKAHGTIMQCIAGALVCFVKGLVRYTTMSKAYATARCSVVVLSLLYVCYQSRPVFLCSLTHSNTHVKTKTSKNTRVIIILIMSIKHHLTLRHPN